MHKDTFPLNTFLRVFMNLSWDSINREESETKKHQKGTIELMEVEYYHLQQHFYVFQFIL